MILGTSFCWHNIFNIYFFLLVFIFYFISQHGTITRTICPYYSSMLSVMIVHFYLAIVSFYVGFVLMSEAAVQLLCNFIEITLCHECSPVNLLHIFRTPFLKNTSGWLLQ